MTLRHPKMHPHTKFGIPTSKNIGDMDQTRKRDGRTDTRTDTRTDGRTVRLLYASQSSFGGIKIRFMVEGVKKKTLNISEKKNSKTSKVNQQPVLIFKYLIIFLKFWTGQSLLTVSFSKIHRQNLKNILFFNEKNNI